MSDIVESLCLLPLMHSLPVGVANVTADAATEITRLREQVRVLRDALYNMLEDGDKTDRAQALAALEATKS